GGVREVAPPHRHGVGIRTHPVRFEAAPERIEAGECFRVPPPLLAPAVVLVDAPHVVRAQVADDEVVDIGEPEPPGSWIVLVYLGWSGARGLLAHADCPTLS